MKPHPERRLDAIEILELELSVVNRTVQAFQKLLSDYFEGGGEILASAQEIDRMEKESDSLERKLEVLILTSKTVTAWNIECVHLADAMDKIANKVEDASDFLVLTRPHVPHSLIEPLLKMAQVTTEACEELTQAWEAFRENPSEITSCTHRIGDLEERIDKISWDATRSLFGLDLKLAEKIHLKGLIDHVAFISNRIEESAQVIEILALRERGRQSESS